MNATALPVREIARWAAVVPGALISAFAAQFPIHWLAMLIINLGTHVNENGSTVVDFSLAALPLEVLEYFANAVFTPFIVIAAGARIAPRFNFQTGIALAVLVAVFIGYSAPQIVSDISEGLYTPGRWVRLAVTIALWIAGFAWGLYSAHESAAKASPRDAA